jgi:hypothetical protein
MTKVICINSDFFFSATGKPLTLGKPLTHHKVYDAQIVDKNVYSIINDYGDKGEYYSNRFITLSEWREKQMKNILDD